MTYVGGLGLCVPAVTGIVGHLVVHVLAEAQLVFGQTHFGQVQVDPADEVAQDRVVDDPLSQDTQRHQLLDQDWSWR